MQKRLIYLLLLTLALILGSPATAFAGLSHDQGGKPRGVRQGESSYFTDSKIFKQVGLVHSNISCRYLFSLVVA